MELSYDEEQLALGAVANILRRIKRKYEDVYRVPATATIKHQNKWAITVHPAGFGGWESKDKRFGSGETFGEAVSAVEESIDYAESKMGRV